MGSLRDRPLHVLNDVGHPGHILKKQNGRLLFGPQTSIRNELDLAAIFPTTN
jgi:hypothetical protein